MSGPRANQKKQKPAANKVIPLFTLGATISCIPAQILQRHLPALVSSADAPPAFQQHVGGIWPRIPEIEPDAIV
jgi:hypothetical protein